MAIVAPTEILAEQHFNNAKRFFDGFNINVTFMSGSVKGAERKERERDIASGKQTSLSALTAFFKDGEIQKSVVCRH